MKLNIKENRYFVKINNKYFSVYDFMTEVSIKKIF